MKWWQRVSSLIIHMFTSHNIAHSAMGRRGGPIELFLVPASAQRLV